MITIEHLTKRYGAKVAVDDLSFSVQPGRVTGFLGPNGSGKSTTMRCMLGLDAPTSGRVLFDGVPYRDLQRPITHVGALLDGKAFHPGRTPRQELAVIAAANGISKARVDEMLEYVGLAAVANKRLKGFSLGMGARLGVAIALIGAPRVLILDEPVNGLDPDGVRWIRSLMRGFAAEGGSVLVSSHLMSEMALTADDLVIVGNGRLIASGPIGQFTREAGTAEVIVHGPEVALIERMLRAEGFAVTLEAANDRFKTGYCSVKGTSARAVGHALAQARLEIWALEERFPTLEDVFMKVTSAAQEFTHGEVSTHDEK